MVVMCQCPYRYGEADLYKTMVVLEDKRAWFELGDRAYMIILELHAHVIRMRWSMPEGFDTLVRGIADEGFWGIKS